jgi:hypothetical protein
MKLYPVGLLMLQMSALKSFSEFMSREWHYFKSQCYLRDRKSLVEEVSSLVMQNLIFPSAPVLMKSIIIEFLHIRATSLVS